MNLQFVDVGRFAIVARNITEDKGFTLNYLFPHPGLSLPLPIYHYPPLYIYLLSLSFKLFGVSDNSVILVSLLFFILGGVVLFSLAKKIFDQKVAFLSTITYLFMPQLFNYAKDGASEPIFIFEIILLSFFLTFENKLIIFFSGVILALSFLTKLQGFWLIVPFFALFHFLHKKEFKLWILFILGVFLPLLPGYLGIFSEEFKLQIPFYLLLQNSSLFPADNLPRSGLITKLTFSDYLINSAVIFKKAFYNIYNLIFKLSEMFAPPAVLTLWGLSFTNIPENSLARKYFWLTLSLMITFLLGSAITSPETRYILPALPVVIIFSINTLLKIVKSTKLALFFIGAFLLLPLLGQIMLDQRALSKQLNFDQPHINKILGEKIGNLSHPNDIVVTNLDTWGSWYGKRTTVIIPTNFNNLQEVDKTLKVNEIFLTNYDLDNEDHPLTGDWKLMFFDPSKVSSKFIIQNFQLVDIATISANLNYENKEFSYVLWKRKGN